MRRAASRPFFLLRSAAALGAAMVADGLAHLGQEPGIPVGFALHATQGLGVHLGRRLLAKRAAEAVGEERTGALARPPFWCIEPDGPTRDLGVRGANHNFGSSESRCLATENRPFRLVRCQGGGVGLKTFLSPILPMDTHFSPRLRRLRRRVGVRVSPIAVGLLAAMLPLFPVTAFADAPTCQGQTATIYVDGSNTVVGGPSNGQPYSGTLTGTTGDEVIVLPNPGTVIGNGGNDVICAGGGTVQGEDVNSIWTVHADGSVSYSDGASTASITGATNLSGGAGNDTFVMEDGASLPGSIAGGAGLDLLDYGGYATPMSILLTGSSATGYSGTASHLARGFSGIDEVRGNTSAVDTLIGRGTNSIWTVDTSLATTTYFDGVKPLYFTGFANLTGGAGSDTFLFKNDAKVTGTVNGGTGTNSIDFSDAGNSAMTVNIGSTGLNDAGTVVQSFTFSSIQNLTGTRGDDTFKLSNGFGLTGGLDGIAGNDTLDYSAWTSAVRVILPSNAACAIGGITSHIANVTGGSGNDILIGDANANVLDGGSGGNDILVGNGGNDTLKTNGRGYSILIGGDGSDTLTNNGSGATLMIGGRTSYDNNVSNLSSIIAEWSRTNETLAQKVSHLTGMAGGLNGNTYLKSSGAGKSVFADMSAVDRFFETIATGPADWVWFDYGVDSLSGFQRSGTQYTVEG
jgi:Ca2+-binding RTX toxin-like protein